MANEFVKVIDQNGVEHPIKDAAAFPWADQSLLGARNLWNEDALYFTALDGTVTKSDGVTNIQVTSTGKNSGAYIPTTRFTANLSDFAGKAGYLSLDVKADKSCSCKIGVDRTAQTINTEWKHIEQSVNDISLIAEYDIYNMDGSTPLISAKNFMIRLASDPDDTYVPYTMTNKKLTDKFQRTQSVYIRTLTSSDNLNDIKQAGIYNLSSPPPSNSPENVQSALLEVFDRWDGVIYQRVSRSDVIYLRAFSTSWTSWTKFTGSTVS